MEDWKKKYEDAIIGIKEVYETADAATRAALETKFPELAESEDERIRKMLEILVQNAVYPGLITKEDSKKCLAYLEKQKEDKEELIYRLNGLMQDYIKESKDDEEKTHRFKCYCLFWDALEDADFFEPKEQKPKFYPGAVIKCTSSGSLWVRCKDGDNIRSDGHTACIGGGFELASEEEAVQFFQELNENGYQWDCIKGRPMQKEQKPAEWSEEDKEMLLSIINAFRNGTVSTIRQEQWLQYLPERFNLQPKQKWSEVDYDEEIADLCDGSMSLTSKDIARHFYELGQRCYKPAEWSEDIIRKAVKEVGLTQHQIDWFKTNVFPPKQEWSEEDERILKGIIGKIDHDQTYGVSKAEMLSFLEKNRHWKPSREQMEALDNASSYKMYDRSALDSLYEQLKQL